MTLERSLRECPEIVPRKWAHKTGTYEKAAQWLHEHGVVTTEEILGACERAALLSGKLVKVEDVEKMVYQSVVDAYSGGVDYSPGYIGILLDNLHALSKGGDDDQG